MVGEMETECKDNFWSLGLSNRVRDRRLEEQVQGRFRLLLWQTPSRHSMEMMESCWIYEPGIQREVRAG